MILSAKNWSKQIKLTLIPYSFTSMLAYDLVSSGAYNEIIRPDFLML